MHPIPLHLDDTQTTAIIASAALIVLDYISGLAKAFATNTISSQAMRRGLWHKTGYVLVIMLAVIVDETQRHIDLGISVPVTVAAGVYIIATEITSILENVSEINPELSGGRLARIFNGKDTPDTTTTNQPTQRKEQP